MFDISLPPGMSEHLPGFATDLSVVGRLGNRVIMTESRRHGAVVLKIGRGRAAKDMRDEARRLCWLGSRLPVPQVLEYATWLGFDFSLLTQLPGRPTHEHQSDISRLDVVRLFARALKDIHSLPVEDCPFVDVTARELVDAAIALDEGRIDKRAFEEDVGESPARVLDRLRPEGVTIIEDTFTHGDFCLPNLLIDDRRASGVIDWGIAGIADVHRDLMSVELTLRRNFGEDSFKNFYHEYGIDRIDRSRIRFYWLLDRFSTHLVDSDARPVSTR